MVMYGEIKLIKLANTLLRERGGTKGKGRGISPPLSFLKVSPYASRSRSAHELGGMTPSGSATEQ